MSGHFHPSTELVDVLRLRRFFSRFVVAPSGCWEWSGAVNGSGYGMFAAEKGYSECAHRVAYSWLSSPISPDLQIDHLCRNKLCVNPAHLEAVTRSQNVTRAVIARGPFCRNGHLLTTETMRIWSTGGGKTTRYCLLCRRASRERNRKVA